MMLKWEETGERTEKKVTKPLSHGEPELVYPFASRARTPEDADMLSICTDTRTMGFDESTCSSKRSGDPAMTLVRFRNAT
jgi:hypothetical protein